MKPTEKQQQILFDLIAIVLLAFVIYSLSRTTYQIVCGFFNYLQQLQF